MKTEDDIDREWFNDHFEIILAFLIEATRPLTAEDPFDEDGYCDFCGNGSWKSHAPWCLWQELRD